MQRLALFDPLFRLDNKRVTDNSGQPIDYFGLGLLTLLFFFENMLLRHNKAGVRELARFFQDVNQGEIDLDVAGFEKLAPDASLEDGLFDIIILKKCNLAEFIRLATLALRGEHLNDPNLIYFQARHIEVSSPDYVQMNLDGEYGGTLPGVFTALPKHLQLLVDETGNASYRHN